MEHVALGYVGGAIAEYWKGFTSAWQLITEGHAAIHGMPIVRRFYREKLNEAGVPNNDVTENYFRYKDKMTTFENESNQYLRDLRSPTLSDRDRKQLMENMPKHMTDMNKQKALRLVKMTETMTGRMRELQQMMDEEKANRIERDIYDLRKETVDRLDKMFRGE